MNTSLVTLEPGKPAVAFAANCLAGEALSLSDLAGQRTWLTFFHFMECPVCLLRANEMMRRYPHWAAPDFQMIAVFHASAEEVQTSLGDREPPFPVICDPEQELYRGYGLRQAGARPMLNMRYMAKSMAAMMRGYKRPSTMEHAMVLPGDFLIDEQGVLHDVYYGSHMGDHISFSAVEKWLGFKLA